MTDLLSGVHSGAVGELEQQLAGLLARCASRDAEAFNRLYDAASPLLFGSLLRILRRRAVAEEALQDVFVSIWQRAAQYEPSRGNALGWMLAIARYRAIDLLRRERSVPLGSVEQIEEVADETETTPSSSLSSDALLERCLNLLTEQQRNCIVHAFVDGSSHDEIAQRTGTPLGTIKSWIRRGLLSLRQCLEP